MKQFVYAFIFFAATFNVYGKAQARPTEISVSAVQEFTHSKPKNVVILDANTKEVRAEKGIVPGAIKLSSYNEYALSELPNDKNTTLVFYCYNVYCQASVQAADRALKAGYKNIRLMRAGIVGWNEATAKSKP
jgi:rhodanese-related sulfurtransferase